MGLSLQRLSEQMNLNKTFCIEIIIVSFSLEVQRPIPPFSLILHCTYHGIWWNLATQKVWDEGENFDGTKDDIAVYLTVKMYYDIKFWSQVRPSFCDYHYSYNQASGFLIIILREIKTGLSLFSPIIPDPLPFTQITQKSGDKKLKIVANVKSRDALECTFSCNLLFHKKSLPSLKLYYTWTCR